MWLNILYHEQQMPVTLRDHTLPIYFQRIVVFAKIEKENISHIRQGRNYKQPQVKQAGKNFHSNTALSQGVEE